MKKWLLFLFIFFSVKLIACECVTPAFMYTYLHSDFIAKARVLKVVTNDNNSEYNDITIEIIDLFKGKFITTIKAGNYLNNNCGIWVPENSIWLIFAYKNEKGILSFNLCSGARQLDKEFNMPGYPNAKQKFEKWLARTIEVLNILKKNKLTQTNRYSLIAKYTLPDKKDLEGYVVAKQTFAIYELTVLKDLTVKKVRPIIEFDNPQLSDTLFTWINKTATVFHKTIKKIPAKTKVLIIYFYYPPEDEYKSFISAYNL